MQQTNNQSPLYYYAMIEIKKGKPIASVKKAFESLKKEEVYTLCLEAVTLNGTEIYNVPKNIIDTKMWETALNSNLEIIKDAPSKLLDYAKYFKAVQKGYITLKDVPKIHKLTDDHISGYLLCLEGAKALKENLRYIPKDHQVYDIYFQSVQNVKGALEHVPKAFRTNELYFEAIKFDADRNIKYIPVEDLTVDLAIEAMRRAVDIDKIIPKLTLAIIADPRFLEVHMQEIDKRSNKQKQQENTIYEYEELDPEIDS